jgi:hypothetical protein
MLSLFNDKQVFLTKKLSMDLYGTSKYEYNNHKNKIEIIFTDVSEL